MALLANLSNQSSGLELSGVYVRVLQVTFAPVRDKDHIQVLVGGYVSAEARESGKQPFTTSAYSLGYDATQGVTMSGIYTALKALPDFAGATDC